MRPCACAPTAKAPMAANNKRKFNKECLRWRAVNFINRDLLPPNSATVYFISFARGKLDGTGRVVGNPETILGGDRGDRGQERVKKEEQECQSCSCSQFTHCSSFRRIDFFTRSRRDVFLHVLDCNELFVDRFTIIPVRSLWSILRPGFTGAFLF